MNKYLLSFLFFLLPIFLVAQTTYPMDGTPITVCSGTFTDSGGGNGNYAGNEDFTTTICPFNTSDGIKLNFTSSDLAIGDTLCFYDGNSTAAPSLGCANDFPNNIFTIQASALNTSRCITVTFQSDGVDEDSGWIASIICTQPCQSFDALIASSTPPISPADTGYIDLCIGDTVFLSGTADFYQNNILYAQDNATSTFEWDMGDGTFLEGENVNHVYEQAGGYYAELRITDTANCVNTNNLVQRIRVTGNSFFDIESDFLAGSCDGDTVTLISNTVAPTTFNFNNSTTNFTNIPIPDGTGASIISNYIVTEFPLGSVVNNISNLPKVCLKMEHSWARDLEIKLTCPDGTSVILHDHPGNTGGELFLGEPNEMDEGLPQPIPGVGYEYCFTHDATNGTIINFANANPQILTLPAGNYNTFDDLTNFTGCPLNGEWAISITDLWGVDNGFLFSWSMNFGSIAPVNSESFTVNVANQGWLPNSSILSSSGDTIVVLVDSIENLTYQINYENGCASDTTIELVSFADTLLACSDCNDLVADAGADVAFDCITPQVVLDASNSSNGAFFEYEWTTIDGQIVSGANNLTAIIIAPGTYVFTLSSSISNCVLTDTVMVFPTQNTPVANAGEDIPFPCNATELILDGGNSSVGSDFTYEWFAGSGQILSGANTLQPVVNQAGAYLLQVNNTINGCTDLDTVFISNEVITDIAVTDATCDNADGSITVSIPSGTTNPAFNWSNGQTGATAENLAQGWYSVTVTYNDTCAMHENILVDEDLSCKVLILGNVYNDTASPNCVEDGLTGDEDEIMLHLMPADIYTYTDADGDYQFITETGNHTIEVLPPSYLQNLCPTDGIINVAAPTNGMILTENDFYVDYVPGAFDLSVSCFMNPARPGFNHIYNIEYCNDGVEAKSGTITFVHDSIETNLVTTPLPPNWNYDATTFTATWTFTDLQPGECLTQSVVLIVPTTTPLMTELTGSLEITGDAGDIDLTNNFKQWNQIVTGAYDPNDKQVFTASGSNSFGGAIYETDTTLFYQIRFQNTGTDTAFTVVVRDTLDASLDVTTIDAGVSSHPYRLEFEENNVLVFNFENIMLPDSNVNEPASNGYVTFSIDRRLPLPFGTTIENTAAIYFDYNVPIITNTVVNVLMETVALENFENNPPLLELHPNPNQGNFTIFYELKKASEVNFSVYDMYGKNLLEIENSSFQSSGNYSKNISIANLPTGIYFLQLKTTQGQVVKKFVKAE